MSIAARGLLVSQRLPHAVETGARKAPYSAASLQSPRLKYPEAKSSNRQAKT
jgi:hypothetical protein